MGTQTDKFSAQFGRPTFGSKDQGDHPVIIVPNPTDVERCIAIIHHPEQGLEALADSTLTLQHFDEVDLANQEAVIDKVKQHLGPEPPVPGFILSYMPRVVQELERLKGLCTPTDESNKSAFQSAQAIATGLLMLSVEGEVVEPLFEKLLKGTMTEGTPAQVRQSAQLWRKVFDACLSKLRLNAVEDALKTTDIVLWDLILQDPNQGVRVCQARLSPQKVDESAPFSFNCEPGTDPLIAQQAQVALARLPRSMAQALSDFGVSFRVVHDHSIGSHYDRKTKTVVLSQTQIKQVFDHRRHEFNLESLGMGVQQATLHELGHGWDDYLGTQERLKQFQILGSTDQLPAFSTAIQALRKGPDFSDLFLGASFREDVKRLTWTHEDKRRNYFVENYLGSPQAEVFCELFARRFLPGVGRISELDFPRTAEAMAVALAA